MRQNNVRGGLLLLLAIMFVSGVIIFSRTPLVFASPPAPNSPTELRTENQVNPTHVTDFTPEFSAIFTDNDVGDNAENMEVWIGIGTVENFENVTDWTYSENDPSNVWSGSSSAGWMSEGGYSYYLQGEDRYTTKYVGEYCEISRNFDFSSINELVFDYRMESCCVPAVATVKILIGENVVWSKGLQVVSYGYFVYDENVDTSNFTGIQALTFRLEQTSSSTSTSGWGVDRLRFSPPFGNFYQPDMWASGWVDIETTENNTRCEDVSYDNTTLQSFENVAELTYEENDPNGRFAGSQDTDWKTGGSYSYKISVSSGETFGDEYGAVKWTLDLTDHDYLFFDIDILRTKFINGKLYIGDNLVWLAPKVNGEKEFLAHRIDISNFTGSQELTLKVNRVITGYWGYPAFVKIDSMGLSGTLSTRVPYYWKCRFMDTGGTAGEWSTETATFKIDYPPNPPTDLLTEGQTNPTHILDFTPEFSAIFTDNDVGDNAENMETWVGTSEGDNDIWASGWIDIATTENGQRSPDVSYMPIGSLDYLWDYEENDTGGSDAIFGEVRTDWFTEGDGSNFLGLGRGYPVSWNENDYGQLSKSIDLTNIDNLILDLKIWGDWSNPYIRGQILVDENVLWENAIYLDTRGTFENKIFDVSGFVGTHQLKFKIYATTTVSGGTVSSLMWIDRIRANQVDTDAINLLSRGVTYYWKCRFMDQTGGTGAWSPETATFKINQLPTAPTLYTNLLMNEIDHTPEIEWTEGTDADGDTVWTYIYMDNTYPPTTLENSTTDNKENIGENSVTLVDGENYYYRLRSWDGYEWSTNYSATDNFRMNQLPSQTYSSPAGITIVPTPPPTITWNFSDPDGDTQLGVSVQATTDNTFATITHWDYEDNTSTAQSIPYGGTTLQRGVQYYVRVQVRDSSGEWSGTWATDNFILKGTPHITSVNANNTLIDRKINQVDSGAVDSTVIYVTARDNWGRSWIENACIWIRDNTDTVVVDNLQLTNYENIDEHTKRFFYDYNPDDSLTALGAFDVKAQVIGADAAENTKDYTDLGYQLFEVNDLIVSLDLTDNTPIHQLSASGTIARIYGTASADNVVVEDDNEGIFIANFTDNSYSQNYGLVSPVRLHRGDQGYLSVWARDDTLDGVSPTLTYEVQGDNASIAVLGITNQHDSSYLDIRVKWLSDDSYTTGTVYIVDREEFQSQISGSGQFFFDHDTWISSGAAVIDLFDNGDRPLWRTVTGTFTTDSVFWDPVNFAGDQDNATVRVRVRYTDGTVPATLRTHFVVEGADWGQKVPDGDGYITWENVNLPDNTESVQLVFENAYDYRSDKIINCKRLEDHAAYYENTNVDFTIDDDNQTIYYGSGGTFSGHIVSKASHVTLKLRENLRHENGSVVDNASITLTPGENESWSLSHAPTVITSYSILLYTDNWALMENRSASLSVKLQRPNSLLPDNENGTTENVVALGWAQVSGADNYVVQYSENDGNFTSYQEKVLTDNQFTTPELAENRWYWRVRAQGENLVGVDWLTHSFWVDRTLPTLDSFSGPSSTTSTSVTLSLSASDNLGEVYQVRFREAGESWGSWQSYATSKGFTLSSGYGAKTVEAQVRDRAGNLSNVLSISITLESPPPPPPSGEAPPPTPEHEKDPPVLVLITSVPPEVTLPGLEVQLAVADASAIGAIEVLFDNSPVAYTFLNDILTVTLFGLEDGFHSLVFRVADEYGNSADRTVSFTVRLPPKPVRIEENIEENIVGERLKVENVGTGEEVKFTFAAEMTSISLVSIENIQEMVLHMIRYENMLAPIPPPDNAKCSYRCFEITLRVDGVENYAGLVGSFVFEFRVEKSWIENENITDVRLYRLIDNSWQPVSTRFVREDFDYRYYEASVTGLSLFSIVGIRAPVIEIPIVPAPPPEGVPIALVFSGIAAVVGGVGGMWFYFRRYAPRVARREIRREITAGPVIRRLKVEFRPLVDKRVREFARELGLEEKKK